jgi:branched-chain amino acid transport system substrate-binding protein
MSRNQAASIDHMTRIFHECGLLILSASLAAGMMAEAQPRTIRIAGFGALTGPVKSFGLNSRAAQQAAIDEINHGGGVRLADGSKAALVLT